MAMNCDEKESLSQFFTRVDDVESLTPDDFIDRFERYGFLWFKAEGTAKLPTENEILDFVNNHSSVCETSWTIENHVKDTKKSSPPKITPETLKAFTGTGTSFYVSTIVHRKPEEEKSDETIDKRASSAHQSLMEMLPKFDNVFEDINENGDPSGTWLFLGHHGVSVPSTNSSKKKPKKQKLSHEKADIKISSTLSGRAEHVDEVTHSGTYHIQISGTKTWKIRPHPDSVLGQEFGLDSDKGNLLRTIPGAEQSKKCWRIKINVEEGDVFVLNTKIWYHCTELNFSPTSSSEWSISVAQDFYLPIPCPRDVKKGDIVYGGIEEDDESNENHIYAEVPDELPRSDNPNCVLVEINGNYDDEDDDQQSATSQIALVALRDIKEGELLTIAFDAQDDQLGNGNQQIDPRVIARQNWSKNQIVVRGEDRMPEDIPRSYEPNCELVEINNEINGGTCLALRALEDIPVGGVFCILPDEDEEYEEVEVDLGTGELMQEQ